MNKKTMTLPILTGEMQLKNIVTNEIHELEFRTKDNKRTDRNFHKIWIKDLSEVLLMIGNQKVKVFCYILDNMDFNNKIIGSIRKIAKKLELSNETVSQTIKALKVDNKIRQIQEGVYMVNPDLVCKGDSYIRQILRGEYYGYKVIKPLTEKEIESEVIECFNELKDSYL